MLKNIFKGLIKLQNDVFIVFVAVLQHKLCSDTVWFNQPPQSYRQGTDVIK